MLLTRPPGPANERYFIMQQKLFLLCFTILCHLSGRAQYCLAHINVIDVENGKVIANQSVYIEGCLIKSISPHPVKKLKTRVYDCAGKYLIPGLWDMHIHDADDDSSNRYEYVPLFLANGVTGIRDMWGSAEDAEAKGGHRCRQIHRPAHYCRQPDN